MTIWTDAMTIAKTKDKALKLIEKDMKLVSTNLENSLYDLPNLPHDSVPDGKDESGNITVRTWGNKPKFSYEPKDHIQLSKELKLFDFKRSATKNTSAKSTREKFNISLKTSID